MKTDLYTKAVLTVIAASLSIIALKEIDLIPKAHASGTGFTNATGYGLVPLNAQGTIDVNIRSSSAMLKVDVADINTTDKLSVNIEEVDSWAFNNCVVPVKIKQ